MVLFGILKYLTGVLVCTSYPRTLMTPLAKKRAWQWGPGIESTLSFMRNSPRSSMDSPKKEFKELQIPPENHPGVSMRQNVKVGRTHTTLSDLEPNKHKTYEFLLLTR